MYTQLASRLNVTTGSDQVSQAVANIGTNAASVEVTVFANGVGDVKIHIDGSNDLENWTTVANDLIVKSGTGYDEGTYFDNAGTPERIAFAYVRLRYQVTSGGAVVAAGINLFGA